jgi:hypothetical protein
MPAPARCDPYFSQALAQLEPPDAGSGMALVAQAALRKLTNVAGRSAKQLGDNAIPKIQNVTGQIQSPSAAEVRLKDIKMSYGELPKTLGARVAGALKRRLFPKTNLTRQQLQHALRISKGTMDNLLSGNHDPSGPTMDKLIAMFRDGFINEVWGAHNIHCICTRAQEKAARIAELHEELRSLA